MLDDQKRFHPNLPSIQYLRGRARGPSSGPATDPTSTFAMKPGEVLFDDRLNHRDLHVYDVLAYHRCGAQVSVGERRLAGAARIKRRSLREILVKLAECGHLEIKKASKLGARAHYLLTSKLFASSEIAEVPTSNKGKELVPKERTDMAALLRCPKCAKRCRQLLRVGYCRSCRWKDNVRVVVREEIAKAEVA